MKSASYITTKIEVKVDVLSWETTFSQFSRLMSTEPGKKNYPLLTSELKKLDDIINVEYLAAFKEMVAELQKKVDEE